MEPGEEIYLMQTSTTSFTDLNDLRHGLTYRATTCCSTATGEYLGMETTYGDRAILLRNSTGIESITIGAVTSIRLAA